jgi:hypothetical protein
MALFIFDLLRERTKAAIDAVKILMTAEEPANSILLKKERIRRPSLIAVK